MPKLFFIILALLVVKDSTSQNLNNVHTIDSLAKVFSTYDNHISSTLSESADSITYIVCNSNKNLIKIEQRNFGNVYTHFNYYFFNGRLIKSEQVEIRQPQTCYFYNDKLIYSKPVIHHAPADILWWAQFLFKKFKE